MLSLPVLDKAYVLERADYIVGENSRLVRDLFDRDLTIVYVSRQIDQKLGLPIASVADQAQVGERLLGRAEFLFHARQQVAEVDEQTAVAFVHVGRQNENAREVIVHDRLLLLGEIADHLERARCLAILRQNVEQKRLHVVVERLVIEEELGEEAEVLTVDLVVLSVDLEETEPLLAVDLASGRMPPHALLQMPVEHRVRLHVVQAVLAEEDLPELPDVVRIGRLVPGLDLVVAELYDLVALV